MEKLVDIQYVCNLIMLSKIRVTANFLTHLRQMFPFYTKDFLVFSGDIKWENWPEMG